jgi:hypothetical protein
MIEPFKTTSIIIDDLAVSITKSISGDMVFHDYFVPSIKLKELAKLTGSITVLEPALIVLIETSDYTYIVSEDLYAVDVPHNYNLSGSNKTGVLTDTFNSNFEKIGVSYLEVKQNSVYLKVSENSSMYLSIKRIV